MKEGLWTSEILQAGSWLIELLVCKHVLPFKKKEECLQGQSPRDTETGRVPSQAQRTEHQATEDYFQALKPKRICPAGFGAQLGMETPLFLFCNGNVYPVPVPPLYLGSRQHFFWFHRLYRQRRILSQDRSYPESNPYQIQTIQIRFETLELMTFR